MPNVVRKLFDENLYKRAKEDLYSVTVGSVEGLLKNNLSISMSSEWENLINSDSILSDIRRYMGAAGAQLFNSGRWTDKYYKGGSYIDITVDMRVVDWEGTGEPVRSALTLYSYVTPASNKTIKGIGDSISNLIDSSSGEGAFSKIKNALDNMLNLVGGLVGNSLTNSPKPIILGVSNYYIKGGMIINNINTTFSKEITPAGPMYADFTISLSSKQRPSAGDIGLTSVNTAPRVEFN